MKDQGRRTPLRTILLNFLNHIEDLETHRSREQSYETEFQELKLFSEALKSLKQYSCSEGEKEVNRKKNRYKDILPFDLSRVILNEYAGIPGSDYINANYIKGASGSLAYIASQGPLPHTVNDFWRMVVQCEVQVIVMACNEEEAGKHKCEHYWVEGEGEEKQFGMVSIRLIKASTVCPDFSVRTMRLKYINTHLNTEERTVCQFHYSAWPDHGVPPLVRPLLDMVRLVRDTQASETLPVLIHCSAGCGRTGTICAIDYVWGLLRAGKLTEDLSLLSLVREMRKQRIAMVQTKEQYVLVYRAVCELFKEQLRMIDSHPYENIDCNGMPIDSCPSHDVDCNPQKEKSKKENTEKEVAVIAPPLPQKRRFAIPSSKHEKEVENLTEKQRIAEKAGLGNATFNVSDAQCPRITKLKSFFEKESKQNVASINPYFPKEPMNRSLQNQEIRRSPHESSVLSLAVKRSKSLRVLGSSDRYKLSIPSDPAPSFDDRLRRLSLESNVDLQESNHYFSRTSVDSVVAGLAVRERRNSFREAINKTEQDFDNVPRKPITTGLVRSYTAIDIRPLRNREFYIKPNSTKPALRPKPQISMSQIEPSSGSCVQTCRNSKHAPLKPHPNKTAVEEDYSYLSDAISSRVDVQCSQRDSTLLLKEFQKRNRSIVQLPQQNETVSRVMHQQSNAESQHFNSDSSNVDGVHKLTADTLRMWKQNLDHPGHIRGSKSKTVVQPKVGQNFKGQDQGNKVVNRHVHSQSMSNYSTPKFYRPQPIGMESRVKFQSGKNAVGDYHVNSSTQHSLGGLDVLPMVEQVQKPIVPKPPRLTSNYYGYTQGNVSGVRRPNGPVKPVSSVNARTVSGNGSRVVPNVQRFQHSVASKGDISVPVRSVSLGQAAASSNRIHCYTSPTLPPLRSYPVTSRYQTTAAAVVASPRPQTNLPVEPIIYGTKLRRGSQDDLALCSPSGQGGMTPSMNTCRVKRNASVVLRHSFHEHSEASPQLTVWSSPQSNGEVHDDKRDLRSKEDPWSGAVGVDIDQVAANMTLQKGAQKDGRSSKLMKAALQALQQRKSPSSTGESSKTVGSPQFSGAGKLLQHASASTTPKLASMNSPISSPQTPFRKQQQYL